MDLKSLSHPLILASASPRRREILEKAGIDFQVRVSNFPEDLDKSLYSPEKYSEETSKGKALAVLGTIDDTLVLSADTIVVRRGKIYEKPRDADECKEFLRDFSGNDHKVITAVTLGIKRNGEIKLKTFSEETKVYFRDLSEKEIVEYSHRDEWIDKSGGYAYQEGACKFVRKIDGCFYNVIGLPLCRVLEEVVEFLGE